MGGSKKISLQTILACRTTKWGLRRICLNFSAKAFQDLHRGHSPQEDYQTHAISGIPCFLSVLGCGLLPNAPPLSNIFSLFLRVFFIFNILGSIMVIDEPNIYLSILSKCDLDLFIVTLECHASNAFNYLIKDSNIYILEKEIIYEIRLNGPWRFVLEKFRHL